MADTSGYTKHLSDSQQQRPPYPVLPPDGALYPSNQLAPYCTMQSLLSTYNFSVHIIHCLWPSWVVTNKELVNQV